MSEVVGEAVVVINTDDSGVDGPGIGKKAGDGFGKGFLGVLKGPAIAGAVAGIAAGIGKTFTDALNFDAGGARLQAQLGLTEEQSARAGEVAGRLYSDNYGDSLAGVQSAVGSVLSSIKGLRSGSEADVEAAARAAQGYADVFGVEVPDAVNVASRLINNGLAKDAPAAFDLLTKASQKVPQALRQDLLDTADEYSGFFDQLGISGETSFALLAQASDQGTYGLDKAGDAIGEFTKLLADPALTGPVLEDLGLNASKTADQIVSGGPKAQDALQSIVQRLLDIPSSSKQAEAAIALFGTPLEDLGTRNIPRFLKTLQDTDKGLGDVSGATQDAVNTMSNTPLERLSGLWRGLYGSIIDVALQAIPPVLSGFDAIAPVVSSVASTVGSTLAPVLSQVGAFLATSVLPVVLRLAGAFADNVMPVLRTAADTFTTVVLPAITSLVSYVSTSLAPVFSRVADIVVTQVLPILSSLGQFFYGTLLPAFFALAGAVITRVKPVFDALVDVFVTRILPTVSRVIDQVRNGLIPALQPVIAVVVAVVGFLIRLGATILGTVLPPLIRFGGFLLANIVPAVVSVITVVARIVGGIFSFIGAIGRAIGAVVGFGGRLVGLVSGGLQKVIDAVADLPGRVLALGPRLLRAGKDLIGKFLDGLSAVGGFAGDFAGKVWNAVKGVINNGIDRLNDLLEFEVPVPGLPNIPVNPPDIGNLYTGTRSWRGGPTWVGEQGPELMSLPRGTRVWNAEESAAMAGAPGQGAGVYIDKLVAHDYDDFTRQARQHQRQAAVGGRRI